MNLEIGNVLELSDSKQYVISSIANYNDIKYLYIADLNDIANVKVCYLQEDNIIMVSDESLIQLLVPLFKENLDTFANE